jgi:hypothetical protein
MEVAPPGPEKGNILGQPVGVVPCPFIPGGPIGLVPLARFLIIPGRGDGLKLGAQHFLWFLIFHQRLYSLCCYSAIMSLPEGQA